uniref:Bromo domain-containing protein n=1 Tax=Kalanchoe fedtschenkoi TaxID=63787 RepID=A0A7N0VC25_KALFE
MPSSSQIPDKSVLQLVIDILQRRDTYEAFGEPVDPDEVADYYVVVKEPMDFGTMRAKLHEGMYTCLEEFEHDAFLIPKNAMLFNPPSSVYFKQAQAMVELAKKAFHLLKTEPEKLRTEFSETRRRSRRLPTEPINGKRKRGGSTQVKPHNMSTNLSPNNHHKPSMSTNLYADIASTQPCSLTGATRSNRDARSSYQPWICFSRGSDSIVSTVYRSSKRLEGVDEKKMHYQDSLMRFAQGLGPIAQKIAARKLQPQAQTEVSNGFQVQLKPASFHYPAPSLTRESTSTPSSMPNISLVLNQEPSTLVRNTMVNENKVNYVERPDGSSVARQENGTDWEEKGNTKASRAGRVPAPESHGRGICLALRSEDTVKGRLNLIGRRRTHLDGYVNSGFSKLPTIQSDVNRANSTKGTDSSHPHCMPHYGAPTSINSDHLVLRNEQNGGDA